MTYKDIDVMKEWDKFEFIEIGGSLDASHKRGEFLRSGQNWEQVEANRKCEIAKQQQSSREVSKIR